MANILIVEDDLTFLEILTGFLKKQHHTVVNAANVAAALKLIRQEDFDLLLSDYRLPDGNGIEILTTLRDEDIALPSLIMTSFNDVRTAVKSIKLGAIDYITKPVNPDELMLAIQNALLRDDAGGKERDYPELIQGESEAAKKLYAHIRLVAPTEMSVIIQGESGTGKEYAARSIHELSSRSTGPFIALDCGALSKDLALSELFGHVKGAFTGADRDKTGQFLAARGGTLFLDEIGNLSYDVQVKLLRAIQERVIQPVGSNHQIPVDVRIVAATNDDLAINIRNGEFREDLYHRLNEFKISLPPLRSRDNDLELFIDHFIKISNRELNRQVNALSADAKMILLNYDWPGNLRELKNVIKRMVLLSTSETAGIDALPEEMIAAISTPKINTSDLKAVNESNERALIIKTLNQVKYNKSLAARLLNIDRKTLYQKMSRYEIE